MILSPYLMEVVKILFTNVIKPTHLCNLNCTYCYNDDVRDPIMTEKTLTRVIEQTFDYVRKFQNQRLVDFIWHGGEPMVAGLDFFEKVIELQKTLGHEVQFANSIQTNGVLINEKWIEFFKKNNFGISISIDGPKPFHDQFRVDFSGKGTFDKVFESIKMVQENGLPLGVCVVINKENKKFVNEIYDFLASNRLPFNIIPMNRSGGARDSYDLVGLEAEEYADAWIEMYDRWFGADEDYVYCSDFVYKTRAILAGRPADCIGLKNCSETNISIDPVGDVFPCATLSGHENTRYGNIVDTDLEVIMNTPRALIHRKRKVDPQCQECKWQHVCHGGCPARSYKFYNDFHARDYYCPSLYKIYEHIESKLKEQGLEAGSPHPDHLLN